MKKTNAFSVRPKHGLNILIMVIMLSFVNTAFATEETKANMISVSGTNQVQVVKGYIKTVFDSLYNYNLYSQSADGLYSKKDIVSYSDSIFLLPKGIKEGDNYGLLLYVLLANKEDVNNISDIYIDETEGIIKDIKNIRITSKNNNQIKISNVVRYIGSYIAYDKSKDSVTIKAQSFDNNKDGSVITKSIVSIVIANNNPLKCDNTKGDLIFNYNPEKDFHACVNYEYNINKK